MNKADCFHLGYVAKLHGFKGEVSLFLDVTNPEDYHNLDAVFIEINNQLTPFFIENFKPKNKGFVAVKFEGVNDEATAKKLVRNALYLPDEILPELDEQHFYDHEVTGFKVIDQKHGDIGTVNQVIDLKVNPLLQISKAGIEILIPLVDGIIERVDRKSRTLYVRAPEGLIELYLG